VPTAAADQLGPACCSPVLPVRQSCDPTSPPLGLATCCTTFIVHKAELAPLKSYGRAGGCAQPTLSLVPWHWLGWPCPTPAAMLIAPLAPLQVQSTLRAAGQAAAGSLLPLSPQSFGAGVLGHRQQHPGSWESPSPVDHVGGQWHASMASTHCGAAGEGTVQSCSGEGALGKGHRRLAARPQAGTGNPSSPQHCPSRLGSALPVCAVPVQPHASSAVASIPAYVKFSNRAIFT